MLGLVFSSISDLSANPFKGEWRNRASVDRELLGIYDDSTLSGNFWGPYESSIKAEYKIKGSSLHYTADGTIYIKDKWVNFVGKKGVCKIEKVTDNIYFQEILKCTGPIEEIQKDKGLQGGSMAEEDLKLYRTLLPEGTARKIQGRDTLSILKFGSVNDTAYLRSAPDVSAKPLKCVIDYLNYSEPYEGQVIAKGIKVFVIARTKTKVKVQKWENYWYYMEANQYGGKGCGPGWIFGEFITIK